LRCKDEEVELNSYETGIKKRLNSKIFYTFNHILISDSYKINKSVFSLKMLVSLRMNKQDFTRASGPKPNDI